ncbi:MAG: transketolase [Anaerolineae bacterium]|nr:transketolase [Anaerolineae bacterium]
MTMAAQEQLDEKSINTIRFLAVDAVEQAQSGHPGTPMGAATMAYTLWDRFLKHNPKNPAWPDRDRFVLSPGHASMLLYALLHLTGYDLPLEELKNFRQWGSKTPGHPEYHETPGVEMTTGPLGQGFAHAVGMAIAERWLAEHYNRPGHEIIDHVTYAIVSDGDMQEGVSSEAASIAGTLRLGKLIFLYDANDIQIEGSTGIAFSEDVAQRFAAYGWQVIGPIDGHSIEDVATAIAAAKADSSRPSLIISKTVIGFGSPGEATAAVHGEPLGEAGVKTAKLALGWPLQPPFHTPEDVLATMRRAVTRGHAAEEAWQARFAAYAAAYPQEAAYLQADLAGELPEDWDAALEGLFGSGTSAMATRNASGEVLNALVQRLHALTGGSADLSPSTKTILSGYGDFGWDEYCGHNMHFGVREHAMGAIAGGMALHGGVIPYTATFLTFSDYMRPPMRLAALMGLRVIYIFTHDSIGLGEDGPTHQPVEHLMNLRAVPNLTVIRPADATETAEAWRAALRNRRGPTALIFSRQKLPLLDQTELGSAAGARRGAYVLWESGEGLPEVILIGTGSEVHVAFEAGRQLDAQGTRARVVSMPSWELFDQQPADYRESVLPAAVRARVAVEAGQRTGWEHYTGLDGAIVGLDGFGASAPAGVLYEKFGITADAVAAEARTLLKGNPALAAEAAFVPAPRE